MWADYAYIPGGCLRLFSSVKNWHSKDACAELLIVGPYNYQNEKTLSLSSAPALITGYKPCHTMQAYVCSLILTVYKGHKIVRIFSLLFFFTSEVRNTKREHFVWMYILFLYFHCHHDQLKKRDWSVFCWRNVRQLCFLFFCVFILLLLLSLP